MPVLVVVIGTIGAGKTNWIKNLPTLPLFGCVIDDSDLREVSHDYIYLIKYLKEGKNSLVCHQWFTDAMILDEFTTAIKRAVPNIELVFIYFENNIEKCRANLIRRHGEGAAYFEKMLVDSAKNYRIPNNTKQHAVWQP